MSHSLHRRSRGTAAALGKPATYHASWGAIALFAIAYLGAMVLIAAPRGTFLTATDQSAFTETEGGQP